MPLLKGNCWQSSLGCPNFANTFWGSNSSLLLPITLLCNTLPLARLHLNWPVGVYFCQNLISPSNIARASYTPMLMHCPGCQLSLMNSSIQRHCPLLWLSPQLLTCLYLSHTYNVHGTCSSTQSMSLVCDRSSWKLPPVSYVIWILRESLPRSSAMSVMVYSTWNAFRC